MPTAPEYDWASASLERGLLRFDTPNGLAKALADGFFFVETPPGFDLGPGDLFATNFYLPRRHDERDAYSDFCSWTSDRLAEHEGYFLRDVDQVEQFFLESRYWTKVFPKGLVAQAEQMQAFAVEVLSAVLSELDLPKDLWERATGSAVSGAGTYHLTFNHFRPTVRARGLNVHKDSGWVTVLRSIEPGLEICKGDAWLPITPRPGTFIVNFGCAMEILTRGILTPVAAVAHRVTEQHQGCRPGPDRFSYALFVDSSLNPAISDGLYCYDPAQGLVLETNFKEFLGKILHNTYELDTDGLY